MRFWITWQENCSPIPLADQDVSSDMKKTRAFGSGLFCGNMFIVIDRMVMKWLYAGALRMLHNCKMTSRPCHLCNNYSLR
jgi:hypothetical protein